MTLKAIETVYNGYRFRSRLEARWAVFFDAMGIDYEYEPEGFELPSGRYLPDFKIKISDRYFPADWIWFEVKPGTEEAQRDDINRADMLMSDLVKLSGLMGIVTYGAPGKETCIKYTLTTWPDVFAARCIVALDSLPGARTAAEAARQARFEHNERKAA